MENKNKKEQLQKFILARIKNKNYGDNYRKIASLFGITLKEYFYELRDCLVNDSLKQVKEREINLHDNILENLEDGEYDLNTLGVQYISMLVQILYHERNLYKVCDEFSIYGQNYFNLDDKENEHYKMLGISNLEVLSEIEKSMKGTPDEGISISQLIYEIVDHIMYHYNIEDNKRYYRQRKKYTN